MRIGIIIGRIGGVDGVALETEKWIEVLQRMGHEIFILSGQFEERHMDKATETLVPEMSFFSPESFWSQKKAFFYPETNPSELIEHINLYSKVIYKKILGWIHDQKMVPPCPLILKWDLQLKMLFRNPVFQPLPTTMILGGSVATGISLLMRQSMNMWNRYFP